MNLDALSDLFLALACAWIIWRQWRDQPALCLGVGAVGIAGVFGVLSFSGVSEAAGPHTFFTWIATAAGLPLVAIAAAIPNSTIARVRAAAVKFLLIFGAIFVALALVASTLAVMVPAAVTGLMIAVWAFVTRRPLAIAGAALLWIAFAFNALHFSVGAFSATQGLHYFMAAAFLMISFALPSSEKIAPAPQPSAAG